MVVDFLGMWSNVLCVCVRMCVEKERALLWSHCDCNSIFMCVSSSRIFGIFFSSRKRKSDRIAFLLINEPIEWMNIHSRKSGSCHKWLNYGFGIFSFWLNECAQFAYRMHDDDNTHSLTHTHNQPLMNEPLYSFYGYVKSTNNGGNDEVVGSIRAHTQSPSNPIQSFPLCLCPSIFNQFTIVHIYDSLNNCVFACMVCEKFRFWAIILKPTPVINVSCREKRRKTTHCNIIFTIFCSILEFVVPRRSIWNGCALNSKPVMWLKF